MTAESSASVIICAYTQKRWDDLNASIASAVAQPEASEVIVVIDHEEALLARVRERWPRLTVVPNTQKQGLSGARNTALELATGDIVAFLDDDASARSDWLIRMLEAFESPEVVAVGGSATPRWPSGRPSATLPPELLWVVGCTYLGQPTRREDVRNVIGCSMAFRRLPLVAVGGFNVDTGRVGTIPLGAEETEVCIRLSQQDPTRRIVFEPASIVDHTVTLERTTWAYLRRRCFYEGVSKAALSRSLGSADSLSSERSYVKSVLPAGAWRELRNRRPLGAFAIVLALVATGSGYVYGTLRGAPRLAAESAIGTPNLTSTS